MFTVSGLPSTGPFDFYRGSGAPVFRTYQTSTTLTSAPLFRVRSNAIKYKYVVTRETDVGTFVWTNPTGVIQGNQEVTIDIGTFTNLLNNGGDTNDLTESGDSWINSSTVARLVDNYSIINKITVGGIVFERFIGDISPTTLEPGFFEYQRETQTIRFQTPDDTLLIGNQPIKIWGSAALGSELDANEAAIAPYCSVVRNNGIVQGVFKL